MKKKKNIHQTVDQPAEKQSDKPKGHEHKPSLPVRIRNFFRLENIFKSNRTIFVFSVVIAIVFWTIFVALDTSQEVTTTLYNVPITVVLGKGAEEMGLQIFGAENLSANVTVSGRRYDLQKITANDIQLTAQPTPVTGAGTYSTAISKGSTGSIDFSIVSVDPKEINVFVDRYIKGRSFDVSVEHDKIGAPEGYILDTAHPSADTITVSGPETEINRISRVAARANDVGETLTKTTYFESTYVFYDSTDEILSTEPAEDVPAAEPQETETLRLKMEPRDLTITVEPASMQVIVPVYQQKTIDVKVNMVNAPEDTSGITCTIEPTDQIKVRIPTDEVLQELDEIQLDVDFTTVMSNTAKIEFPVDQLQIPAGYTLEDDITSFVVQIALDGKASTLTDVSTIRFADEMAAKQFMIVSTKIENVRVVGNESAITDFNSNDIAALVDTPGSDVTADQIEVPVRFVFSNNKSCWIYNRASSGYTVTLQRITSESS